MCPIRILSGVAAGGNADPNPSCPNLVGFGEYLEAAFGGVVLRPAPRSDAI
ncbi:hypothetical protein N601_29350 [Rhodococcus erythropolis DN1]|nr:hypothetical protein N601_29350 [Rhodococcus erythropolis DN1]